MLQLRGDSLDWLAFRLMWMGVDFRILEPAELIDAVAGLAERLRRAATTGSD